MGEHVKTFRVFSGGSRIFEKGVTDLTERYQNNQRQNPPSNSSVPFHNLDDPKDVGSYAPNPPLDPPLGVPLQ